MLRSARRLVFAKFGAAWPIFSSKLRKDPLYRFVSGRRLRAELDLSAPISPKRKPPNIPRRYRIDYAFSIDSNSESCLRAVNCPRATEYGATDGLPLGNPYLPYLEPASGLNSHVSDRVGPFGENCATGAKTGEHTTPARGRIVRRRWGDR